MEAKAGRYSNRKRVHHYAFGFRSVSNSLINSLKLILFSNPFSKIVGNQHTGAWNAIPNCKLQNNVNCDQDDILNALCEVADLQFINTKTAA